MVQTMSIVPVKWSILVVDDDVANREILTESIKQIVPNADIAQAANGEQAVILSKEKVGETHQNYHVIFMDYQMPLMNGQEATQAIRQFEKHISLNHQQSAFIITWSAARRTPFEGANAAIAKPLIQEELVNILQEYY
jgi:CheY-like chemotaxis protein